MSGKISGISYQGTSMTSCHHCGTGNKKKIHLPFDGQTEVIVDTGYSNTPRNVRVLHEKGVCGTSPMMTVLVALLSLLVVTLLLTVAVMKSRMDSFQEQLDSLTVDHLVLQEKFAKAEGLDLETPSTPDGLDSYRVDVLHRRIVRNAKSKKKDVKGGKKDKKKEKTKSCKKICKCAQSEEAANAEIEKYCDSKIASQPGKQLESVEFEGNFYDIYNYSQLFGKECQTDEVHQCKFCRHASVEYFNKYSPLHVYLPKNETSTKLIRMINNTTFETMTAGSYLVHLDIVMIDEYQNHSVGIFVNSKAVLVCPKGGFLLPNKDNDDIVKFRLCNIDGMVTLKEGDKIQIQTMHPHTTVRLESKKVSVFKLILLQPVHPAATSSANKS